MTEPLFLTGPVILNGVPDSDNDTLNSVEIRTIFSKYTKHLGDIQHDRIDYDGFDILANWINEEEMQINGNTVPAKSWMATAKVTNPEIIKSVNKGELTCFSLGSVSEEAKTRETWFINKRISYHDLKDIEMVEPLRISIVDRGANGFPFEIADYNVFINKNEGKMNMTNNENIEDAKFSIKEFLGLGKLFNANNMSINKNEARETQESTVNNDKFNELSNKMDTILENQKKYDKRLVNVENKINKTVTDEKPEESEEPEKPEENSEETINKEEETTPTEPQKTTKPETSINKSVTTKVQDIPHTITNSKPFYQRTNRDPMGRKLRR